MIMIIGGKLDGQEKLLRVISFQEKDEQYLMIEFKEKTSGGASIRGRFYMLAGMVPAEAMKIYRHRQERPRDLWGK